MPRNPYPGTKLASEPNFFSTKVNFGLIYNSPKLNDIRKATVQCSLDNDKVNSMCEEYMKNPLYLRFKNYIVIGDLNGTWCIIDGQHRIEMAKILYTNHNIDDNLIFLWYKFKTETEMNCLFNSINKDSLKNHFYLSQDERNQIKINEFVKILKQYHKVSFVPKKTVNGKIKTIEEFRDDLIQINIYNKFNEPNELYKFIRQKNSEFYEKNRYSVNLEKNKESFYKDELKHINEKIIFSLKNTNFIEWLNNESIEPFHKYKKGKKRITRQLKFKCWDKEFYEPSAKCPITFCPVIIKKEDTDNWHAGHVISESNNGDTCLNNLRPICKKCNLSMGSKNWVDFEDCFQN